jgi:hypothetical protein
MKSTLLLISLFFLTTILQAQEKEIQYTIQGAKPGIDINGVLCKIGHLTQSCTPRVCDSIYILTGYSIEFCTSINIDLTSDTAYYMQWNFTGSINYVNTITNTVPTNTPFCFYPIWSTAGVYILNVL